LTPSCRSPNLLLCMGCRIEVSFYAAVGVRPGFPGRCGECPPFRIAGCGNLRRLGCDEWPVRQALA
jgi:hypothetical protein